MTLDKLRNKPCLAKQLALLDRLGAQLTKAEACLGAAVGGSLATDSADHMSDVDLVVYCQAGTASALMSALSAAAETLPVIYRLSGRHDGRSVYEKVVLEDWSSYEIHVIEPSTQMRLKPPFLTLVNKQGYLETRVSEDKPIGRETLRPLASGEAGLFWELFNCMKWLRRGEFRFTSKYLQQLGTTLAERQSAEDAGASGERRVATAPQALGLEEQVALRPARPEDADAVAHVLCASRREFVPFAPLVHEPEEVQSWVAQHLLPAGGVSVATSDDQVVAFLAASETDTAAWIDHLYVLPGYENQGFGTELLCAAHARLRRPVRAYTFQQNAGARRFYERHGYKVLALSDGQGNEERCPDVLYELQSGQTRL